jgi:hypothetical protein
MTDADPIRRFFRSYDAVAVGATPEFPPVPADEDVDEGGPPPVDLGIEVAPDLWAGRVVGEAPARSREFPVRFIDGSQTGQPVLCVRAPAGWPIALVLAEVGAVALRSSGRTFVREFRVVDRVLSFVAHPFPWAEVEGFAAALANNPAFRLRVLPANMPKDGEYSPFDYGVMRQQAYNRCQQEMLELEVLALATEPGVPTLVDGQLGGRIGETAAAARPLLVGAVKRPTPRHLHDAGWRTLLTLRPGQRTPCFKIAGVGGGKQADIPLVSWFLKLAGGARLAPNWGFVRVDVPWIQFERQFRGDFGFVDRLSRWLIDARCRQESYARMPVSLDPIVRAGTCSSRCSPRCRCWPTACTGPRACSGATNRERHPRPARPSRRPAGARIDQRRVLLLGRPRPDG